jgi:hypothetical protein
MASHSIQTRTDAYKCVIALNNIGVSLMERGAYLQAAQTFKEAVVALQLAMRVGLPLDFDEQHAVSLAAIHESVRSAYQRVAKSVLSSVATRTECLHAPEVSVRSISNDEWDPIVMKSILADSEHSFFSNPLCIRIEPSTCGFEQELGDCELNAAILLQNFGVAQMCLLATTSIREKTCRYQSGAMKLFRIAYTILLQHRGVIEHNENDQLHTTLMITSATTLNSLGQLLLLGNREEEASQVSANLAALVDSVTETENLLGHEYYLKTSRSAAAA